MIALLFVYGPINLDDQARGVTVEVHNEPGDYMLAAEVQTVKAVTA
jgi:hypothetical protein